MANIKINELEELLTASDDDILPVVDISSNETKKINVSNLQKKSLDQILNLSQTKADKITTYTKNEIDTITGTLLDLNMTEKTNLVGAINEVYENNIYSTSEKKIGVWMNKPLYRKVIEIDPTTLISGVNQISYDFSNIDIITNLRGISERQYNIVDPTPRVSDSSSLDSWFSTVRIDKGNNKFEIELGTTFARRLKEGFYFYVIFEYTKTTD